MPKELSVTSPQVKNLLFARLTGTESLGRLFSYELRVASTDGQIKLQELLGTPMYVTLKTSEGYERYFHGIVCQAAQLGFVTVKNTVYAQYSFRLVPKPWLLTRKSDCRIFTDMTVPDIVKQVLSEFGYTDLKLSLSTTYPKREYCVQYREDSFNFISRLMEQEGIYYYFQHSSSTHTMVLADALGAHSTTKNFEKLVYRANDLGLVGKSPALQDWGLTRSLDSTCYQLTDYDPLSPKASLLTTQDIANPGESHKIPGLSVFDYPGDYTQTEEGDRYAKVRVEALNVPRVTHRGVSDACGVACGALFNLQDFPRKDLNQNYLIVGTDIQLERVQFVSGENDTDTFLCTLDAIPSKESFRSQSTAVKPLIVGLQTAVVTGSSGETTGEDIAVDKYGRIWVTFYWALQKDLKSQKPFAIRVATPWAGKNWGAIHIPRVGQEVVVSFLEGDPDRPLIIGSVYNADNMPPYELPANMTQSGIKSRSHKGGGQADFNEIRFEDKKGSEQVLLHAQKDLAEEVESDHTVSVGHDETETIKNDRTHNVDNNDTLKVTQDRTTQIGNNDSLTVASDGTTNIGQKFSLEAGTEIQLVTGASSIVMKSTGDIEIKGLKIRITGQAEVDVIAGGRIRLDAGGVCKIEAGGVASIEAGGAAIVKGALLKLTGSGMATLSGGIINIG